MTPSLVRTTLGRPGSVGRTDSAFGKGEQLTSCLTLNATAARQI